MQFIPEPPRADRVTFEDEKISQDGSRDPPDLKWADEDEKTCDERVKTNLRQSDEDDVIEVYEVGSDFASDTGDSAGALTEEELDKGDLSAVSARRKENAQPSQK